MEEMLSWLGVERGRSANTLAAYRRDLAAYNEFLTGRGLTPATVTEPVIEDYLAFLRAAGRAPASVARALVSVRSLHRFLEDEGHVATNPAGGSRGPRCRRGCRRPCRRRR
jgi:integrase/recombinase XerD